MNIVDNIVNVFQNLKSDIENGTIQVKTQPSFRLKIAIEKAMLNEKGFSSFQLNFIKMYAFSIESSWANNVPTDEQLNIIASSIATVALSNAVALEQNGFDYDSEDFKTLMLKMAMEMQIVAH